MAAREIIRNGPFHCRFGWQYRPKHVLGDQKSYAHHISCRKV
jgi:hypothetical protein